MNVRQVGYLHQGQLVAKYRMAAKLSQGQLAEYIGVSVHTVQRMEKEAVIKDSSRRSFLVALLGIPAIYMDIDKAQQKIQDITLFLNDDPMSFFEDMVTTRWKVHLMGGPLSAAHGLEHVVQEVERFAQNMQGKAWHRRAQIQLCMTYQLQGSVAGDSMHYGQALHLYQQAFDVAKELDDVELMASVRVREGIVHMRKNDPQEAVSYLDSALDLIHGRGFPHLRGNILGVISEAYANAQQPQECWRAIGLAERVLEQQETSQERSHRLFSPAIVSAHKGTDALLLHDYDRALTLIDKSLKMYNPTFTPGRARLLARKAEVYYWQEKIDDCADIVEEAWVLARSVGAYNTLSRLKKLFTELVQSRWRKEPCVISLGILLAS